MKVGNLYRVVWAIAALAFISGVGNPVQADQIIASGPKPSGVSGSTAVTNLTYFTQPFSLNQDLANAEFRMYFGSNTPSAPIHGIISTVVGGGATQDDVLVEFDVPALTAPFFTPTTVLNLDAIAAGSYFLTFGIESGFTQTGPFFEWAGTSTNDFGSVGTVMRTPSFGDRNSTRAEASNFQPYTGLSNLAMRMVVNGDLTNTPPGIPGGNETFFDFDPPAIDGVGVTVADLGAEHGNDSQSIAGSSDTTMSTLTRTFAFDSADTDATSVEIFIHAILEGRLIADNFSSASARGMLEIRNEAGDLVDNDGAFVQINALGGELAIADVFEVLTLGVFLTPGETYTIESKLTLMTDAGLSGAARALFADTFAYEISAINENPFGDPGSGTTYNIPEPASFAVIAFLLAPIGVRRSGVQHSQVRRGEVL